MAAERDSKISPRLLAVLVEGPPDDACLIEVVVELQRLGVPAEGKRQERMAAMQESFQRASESVTRQITQAGGQVLGHAWINRTVRGRIPADQLPVLASDDVVVRIDVPSSLKADEATAYSPSSVEKRTMGS
jgi:hypothetical protein